MFVGGALARGQYYFVLAKNRTGRVTVTPTVQRNLATEDWLVVILGSSGLDCYPKEAVRESRKVHGRVLTGRDGVQEIVCR